MIARAAGLKTFADLERNTYLLTTATEAVKASTYQGSWARRTIATIMALSTAPDGNSQTPFRMRRTTRSMPPPAAIAAASPMAIGRQPWPGAASPIHAARTSVSRPFSVAKNLTNLRRIAETSGFEAREPGCEDQAFDSHALEEGNPAFRPHDKSRRGQRIRDHRGGRNHGDAGSPMRGVAGSRICH